MSRPATRAIERTAIGATLLLPLCLLHSNAVSEVLVALIDIGFLSASAITRNWSWWRQVWVRLAILWWAWLVVCSLPGVSAGGWPALLQALVVVRYLVLVAALQNLVLRRAAIRLWLARIVTACAAYIALQSLLQFATGHNLYGDPPASEGELTGPFRKPRAGSPLARLLPPALLPPVSRLLARGRWARGALLAFAGLAIMVLIGQRMPLLLTALGLLVSAVFIRRLRVVVLVCALAGAALLASTIVVAPSAYYRLVLKFSTQMAHFAGSDYGRLAARAVAIAAQSPWTGYGFDGFRHVCAEPRFFHGWDGDPDGGGLAGCNIHPHNYYLQALTDAGIPGLVLFSALLLTWLAGLARGLWRTPEPLRVGLFAAAFMQIWPIASTTSFFAMEVSGWFFLLLGWGLAEAGALAPEHGRP